MWRRLISGAPARSETAAVKTTAPCVRAQPTGRSSGDCDGRTGRETAPLSRPGRSVWTSGSSRPPPRRFRATAHWRTGRRACARSSGSGRWRVRLCRAWGRGGGATGLGYGLVTKLGVPSPRALAQPSEPRTSRPSRRETAWLRRRLIAAPDHVNSACRRGWRCRRSVDTALTLYDVARFYQKGKPAASQGLGFEPLTSAVQATRALDR